MTRLPPQTCQKLHNHWASIRKKRVSTPSVELKHLQEACKVLCPGNSSLYSSVHERPSSVRPMFDTHVHVFDDLFTRYKQSVFLSMRHPSEPAMRAACTYGWANVLVSQLDFGYGPNAQILIGDPRQTQDHTYLVIECVRWPSMLSTLLERGCDLNVVDDRGRSPLKMAVDLAREYKSQSNGHETKELKRVNESLEILLRAGAVRGNLVHTSTRVKRATKLLAAQRWKKVQRLVHTLNITFPVLRELHNHVRFRPEGCIVQGIRQNWETCCRVETSMNRGEEYDVDAAEYFME